MLRHTRLLVLCAADQQSETHCVILLQGRTQEVEPWYSTGYSQEPVPNEWLSSWLKAVPNSAIHLPKPKPFISSAFGLIDVRGLPITSAMLHYSDRPHISACSTC